MKSARLCLAFLCIFLLGTMLAFGSLKDAKKLADKGDSKAAIAEYQKVIAEKTKSDDAAEALYRIGVLYFDKEADYKKAQESFAIVVNEFPNSPLCEDAQLMLAKSYEKAEEYQKAVEAYGAFIMRYPKGKYAVQATLLMGDILKDKLNKADKAKEVYQGIVLKFGMDKDASVLSQVEEAKKRLKDMGAEIPKPVDALATPEARRAAQREAMRERDRPKSSTSTKEDTGPSLYTSSFGVNPNAIMKEMKFSLNSEGTYYDAMYMVANMLLQEENYRDAGALYEKAIQLGVKDAKAYRDLATCYRKVGLTDKARETLRQGTRIDPKLIDDVIASGDYLLKDEDYDKAIETYQSVLGLFPRKDSEIYYHLGEVYDKQDNTDKAIDMYERAIAFDTSNKDAYQNLAYLLYYKKGDEARAGIFQDAGQDKSSYEISKEIGDLCYRCGSYNSARIKYQSAARSAEQKKSKAEQDKAKAEQDKSARTDQKIYNITKEIDKLTKDIEQFKRDALLMKVKAAVSSARRGDTASFATYQKEMDELTAEPNSAIIHYGIAEAKLLLSPEEAVAEYNKALELEPNFLEATVALGEYYISTGKKEEALKLWEGYLARNPREPTITRLVNKLKTPPPGTKSP